MNVLAVLENEAAQLPMTEMLSAMEPEANLMCFGSSLPALAAARKQEIDIAVIDAVLPELSGLDFGSYLKELYPNVNLIYLSSDRSLGFEALRQHASGILPKPIVETELRRELDELRYPQTDRNRKRLFAQTFGNFELFADGKPVVFKYTIECDLYDWLEKKQESKYQYLGDYMNQYSGPEVMHAQLDEIAWSFDE